MLESGQVNFIRRDHFLNFLNDHAQISLRVAKHLSGVYAAVHEQMCALALSDSVTEKLARLLLSWRQNNGEQTEQPLNLKLSLTHGEIAQMIGASRETVTRLLSELRKQDVIRIKGSNLFIIDRSALERLVSSY
jgi:CRP/FNR family transcriptional regulator